MAFSRALLLKGLAGAATVGAVGGGVVLGGNLLKSEKETRKEVNGKLGSLGLEGDCLLDESEDPYILSKECGLDGEKLKKIRFSNKGEGELKVVGQVPQELKLKIEGNKEDISFSFKGISSSPLAIVGDKSKGKIILKEDRKFKDVKGKLTKDSGSVDETLVGFNRQLKDLNAPAECRFDEKENEESIECSVTEEDLKVIKFSGLGEGDQKVKGEVSAGLKLKAERDQENAMSLYFTGLSGNLTILVDQKSEEIDIRSGKKFWIGEDGKLKGVSKTVDPALKAKAKEFNGQLGKVNAPLSCRFDEGDPEESIECSITQRELKTMKFSNKLGKDDLRIVGSVDPNLKLKMERDQQNEMSLFFTGLEQNLTIYGHKNEGKIVVKGSETKFKVEGDKLEKESISSDPTLKAKLRGFNKQLATINVPTDCRFDDAEAEESIECSITKDQFEKIEFSNKEDKKLNIVGWNTGNVKLRAEKDSASPDTMSISFPGISQDLIIYGSEFKGKIVVKGSETKFNVINNTLTKGTPSEELKKFNYKLGTVAAPIECRFDAAETEESVECSVTPDSLKIMAFSESEGEELTLSNESFSGMKLNVQIVKTFDSEGRENGKVLILTFKDYQNTVELKYDDEDEQVIAFVKNTNPEFLIDGKDDDDDTVLLAKMWDQNAFEGVFNLDCGFEDGNTPIECSFTEEGGEINVGKGTGDDFEKLTVTDKNNSNFELHAEEEGYNQGYKFVFKGKTVSGSEGVSLESDGEYEFKWKVQKGKPREYYLVKRAN